MNGGKSVDCKIKRNSFCCAELQDALLNDRKPLYFDGEHCYYFFYVHYQKRIMIIRYCPWCKSCLLGEDMTLGASLLKNFSFVDEDDFQEYPKIFMPETLRGDGFWVSSGVVSTVYWFDTPTLEPKNFNQEPCKDYNPVCCDVMKSVLISYDIPIEYTAIFRHYLMRFEYENYGIIIYNCPWCASVFPPSLYQEYRDLASKELGLDDSELDSLDFYVDDFPQEFQTDLWWRKRGL